MTDIEERLAQLEARVAKLEGKNTGGKRAMAQDWEPREQDIEWVEKQLPIIDWRFEADKFRDFWIAKGERKANWNAAFRNWCRQATVYQARLGAGKGRSDAGTAGESASPDTKRQRVLDKLASIRQVTRT